MGAAERGVGAVAVARVMRHPVTNSLPWQSVSDVAWRIDEDGTGRLKVLLDPVKFGDFSRIGSASLHEMIDFGNSATELLACGVVISLQ